MSRFQRNPLHGQPICRLNGALFDRCSTSRRCSVTSGVPTVDGCGHSQIFFQSGEKSAATILHLRHTCVRTTGAIEGSMLPNRRVVVGRQYRKISHRTSSGILRTGDRTALQKNSSSSSNRSSFRSRSICPLISESCRP